MVMFSKMVQEAMENLENETSAETASGEKSGALIGGFAGALVGGIAGFVLGGIAGGVTAERTGSGVVRGAMSGMLAGIAIGGTAGALVEKKDKVEMDGDLEIKMPADEDNAEVEEPAADSADGASEAAGVSPENKEPGDAA